MVFFDWLLGYSRNGVKTLLLSGLIGLGLFPLLGGDLEQERNKYFCIALGYPLLLVARSIYWSWRKSDLLQKVGRGVASVERELDGLLGKNDRLLAKVTAAREAWETSRQRSV